SHRRWDIQPARLGWQLRRRAEPRAPRGRPRRRTARYVLPDQTPSVTDWMRTHEPCAPRPRPGPVRVCFLIDELSRGGTESHLLELLHGLDRRHVQPHLCLMRRTPAGRDLEPRDCPVLDLGISTFFENFFDLSLGPKVLRLSRYLRANRIEVM